MSTVTDKTHDNEIRNRIPLESANVTVRTECADAFASEFADGAMTDRQRKSAEVVLQMFAEDTALEVREAIVGHLAACPFLPPSVARMLANDVDAVAIPMIRNGVVFADDDLIDIVNNGTVSRQIAVATRDTVSAPVSSALVARDEPSAVAALLANDGARISDSDYTAIIERHGENSEIETLLVGRSNLPLAALDRLLEAAGLEYTDILEDALDLPGAIVQRICTLAKEQLIVAKVRDRSNSREVEELVTRLKAQKRLSSTLLLRALCTGDAEFFSIGLAELAGAKHGRVRALVNGGQTVSLKKIYAETGLPRALFRAFSGVIGVYIAEKGKAGALEPDVFTPKAVDRLVHEYTELSPGNLDEILAEVCWRIC